jgi:DNA-binding transcriptional ArsR family regulator
MVATDVTPMFRALGDPTRRRIFEFLCERCCPVAVEETGEVHQIRGATVGDVCCHVTGSDKFSSTISFHIKELRLAGLITAERVGKFMVCSIRREAIGALNEYLASLPNPDPSLCSSSDPTGNLL